MAVRALREKSPMQKILFTLFAPVIWFLLFSEGVSAQDRDILKSLKAVPISQAASVPSPNIKINQPADPRTDKIEQRLREIHGAIQTQKHQAAAVSGGSSVRHQKISKKLRRKLSDTTEVRTRSSSGTPRQIRVKPEAKRKGEVLEKAAAANVAGRSRDEQTARNFLRSRRDTLRIQDPDKEFQVLKYIQDHLGRRHLRYRQVYQEIPVWPAELNVHLDASGNVDLMNGAFVATPRRVVTQPVWTAEESLRQARMTVPSGEYARAAHPELILYAFGKRGERLGWKIGLSVSPESDWVVVVDALNGNIMTAYNRVPHDLANGSGRDLFGNTRPLAAWHEGGSYYMADTSKSMYDPSSDPPSAATTRGGIMVYDMANSDNPNNGMIVSSGSLTSGWLSDAVSLTYSLSETYDYFFEHHSRKAIDNNKGSILGFVRYGKDYENAFWTSEHNAMFFGDGVPYAGALDVVAHEYTHGVTSYTCNLIYQDQPGAINEAFSDIFGEMVEARTTGGTDWQNGTVLSNKRSLENPASMEIGGTGFYYPDKMSAFYGRNHSLLQQFKDQDYGGVHINMTIVSHCYYLLARGLEGAIGITDAGKIFYRAQTIHLVSNSQFVDLRLACIVSAEELFGENSVQVRKVKEAFDAVEIFDNPATPEPPPMTPVEGDDAVVFLSYSPNDSVYFLARQEDALGDDEYGAWLSCYDLALSRPSVTGDGDLALFVDSLEDACLIPTDGALCEECLGFPGMIHSVAMSPDGQVYGMVLLDDYGSRDNSVTVIDLRPGGSTRTFQLVAPATEGVALNTVQYADAMSISADNRYLFYDAFNVLEFRDGTRMGVWSIYAIDLISEQTIAIAGPFPGYDIGFPSLGRTRTSLVTFDMMDQATGDTLVVAGDLLSGDFAGVGSVTGGNWTVPCYTADDSAIVYSVPDILTYTVSSLMRQMVSGDSITPVGQPALYIPDAYAGVMYRRGSFTPPVPEIDVSAKSLAFGSVAVGTGKTKTVTVSNSGTSDLMIMDTAISGAGKALYQISGGCTGQILPPSGECVFNVGFFPTAAGMKGATLTITSNDPVAPVINLVLNGTGAAAGQAPPEPPSNVAASDGRFNGNVQVTWNASASAASYDVFRADMPAWTGTAPKRIASSVNGISYNDTTAVSGNRYYYWVKARNSGGVSKYSNFDAGYWGSPGVIPGKPTDVFASPLTVPGNVTIQWSATSNTLIYEIWRADIPAFLGGNIKKIGISLTTSYNDATVVNGKRYYYWVKARNSWGVSRYSLFDTGYIGAASSPLPAPTGVIASDGTVSGKVNITWDSTDGAMVYEIWRATDLVSAGGHPVRVGFLSDTSFDDTSGNPGVTYYYWVKARDSWGSSRYSVPDTGYY